MEPAGNRNIAIETRELTRRFGKFVAVDHISFSVKKGEIFGFLGPNGAGKSTTIRMLCGLLKPTSGAGYVNGIDIAREPEAVRQVIGYMSQKFSLYRDLSVIENLRFFGSVYGLRGKRLDDGIDEAFWRVGLDGGARNRITGELSGAIMQRVALACAILHKPAVLFLDEPTSGIDPAARRLFWALIQDLSAEGVTVLVTTHFLDEAEFCQRVGFINSGRLIAIGTPREFKEEILNEDIFELTTGFEHDVLSRLMKIAGVADVSYFGDKLHLFADRGRFTTEFLLSEIQKSGCAGCAVKKIKPRLEDVFVRLAKSQSAAVNNN
ncbi:MAG: ABC transporter ATP-binding protein [Verrucomicrobiia bacterium]|jgi:ABC-2 type transport system ATP-binding protein